MGSRLGALKIAALRVGISFDEYLSKVQSGFKWCTFGKHWDLMESFGNDLSRSSGKQPNCINCSRLFQRSRKRHTKHFKRTPAKERAAKRVGYAVKSGKLPKASSLPCQNCGHIGNDIRHGYHHHHGYAPEQALDVVVLCAICHYAEHHRN